MNADTKARINSYRSKALEGHPRCDEIHDIARRVVRDSRPVNEKTAGTTMTWVALFYRWVADNGDGEALNSAALTEERVDRFLETELDGRPKGTVEACRSYLQRCMPGSTLERRPARHVTRPFPPDLSFEHTGRRRPAPDDGSAIEEAIHNYIPDGMEDADWAHVRDTCIDWTLRAEPNTADRSRSIMTQAAWLLEWALTAGLDFDSLLVESVIERFFDETDVKAPSRSVARSVFNQIIAAVRPEHTWNKECGTGAVHAAPYSDDQIEWFWNATTLLRDKTRPHAQALLMLIAGAGAPNGADARSYAPQSFAEKNGRTFVTNSVTGIEIPVMARWEPYLRAVLDELDGDRPLLGTSAKNRATEITRSIRVAAGDRHVEIARLHGNWLLHAVTTEQNLADLVAFNAQSTLASFDRVLPYVADHRSRSTDSGAQR